MKPMKLTLHDLIESETLAVLADRTLPPSEIRDILEEAKEQMRHIENVTSFLQQRLASTISGYPMKQVRAVLRGADGETQQLPLSVIRERISFKANDEPLRVSRRMMADLVTDGYAIQIEPDVWAVTERGRQLQGESRGRLTRKTADKLFDEFRARLWAIENQKFAYTVKTVVLFGSYLSDNERMGDIDIAIEVEPRYRASHLQKKLLEERRQAAPPKAGRNFLTSMGWPQLEVNEYLKGGSRFLEIRSLAEITDLANRDPKFKVNGYKVIHGYWSPDPFSNDDDGLD